MEFGPQLKRINSKSKRKKRSVNSLLKVVYISSPMMVKTSATKFRTLVQELTGRDSDISRFMDSNITKDFHHQDFEILPEIKRASKSTPHNHQQQLQLQQSVSQSSFSAGDPYRDSPTSSESFLEQGHPPTFDETFINEQYYQGLLSSDLFSDSSELDVLGSYDAL